MKISSFSQLLQVLTKKQSLLVVYTKDEFEQKNVINLLPDHEILEGSNFSKEVFFEATEQATLFKKKTYLVIKECQLLTKNIWNSIAKYLQKPRADLALVLFSSEPISDETVKKLILEKGVIFSLLEEKPWDKKARLVHESLSYLEKENAIVATKIVQQLVESFLNDQRGLRNELDKWISYLPFEKTLTFEEAEQLTFFSKQETIWMVGDAIFKKEREQAYQFAMDLYESSSLFALLGGLRSQVQTAIDVLHISQNYGKDLVTKRFPYLAGTLLEKRLSLFQGYGLFALYRAKEDIYRTELKAKQYPSQEKCFLEQLVITLTA